MTATSLGAIGVWTNWPALTLRLAQDVEAAGCGTVWAGGSPAGDLRVAEDLLAATDHITVATGIVNVWSEDARLVAASHHRIRDRYPGRFLLGVGVGHPEWTSDYAHPYRALVEYLDLLDAQGVPEQERILAARGPEVLQLATDRSAGAHPYLTTPAHTRQARALLGDDGALLAPEHKIVLESDPAVARRLGRELGGVSSRMERRNYVANLVRLEFTDRDFAKRRKRRPRRRPGRPWGPDGCASGERAPRRRSRSRGDPVGCPAGHGPVPGYRALAEVLLD